MLRRFLVGTLALVAAAPLCAQERAAVDVSAPSKLAVTVYRDPNRGENQPMERGWPQGFAMISETRTVTLPPGRSTVRFTGVGRGHGGGERDRRGPAMWNDRENRDADLLTRAALVDGTLGNPRHHHPHHPATGQAASESAVIRTRADGGLVLQTREGFDAVRCSGLPEKLTFDRLPAGLSLAAVVHGRFPECSRRHLHRGADLSRLGFDWEAITSGHLRSGAGATARSRSTY